MTLELNDDFDFGFSLVDETELEAVQEAQQVVASTSKVATVTAEKIDKLYNMVMPLLNNLAKNPEKEYIYWPNRVEKIEAFRDKLRAVYQSQEDNMVEMLVWVAVGVVVGWVVPMPAPVKAVVDKVMSLVKK